MLPATIVDAAGEPANAVHGFADFLADFLARVGPTHCALVFDESLESSLRHAIDPGYKANRTPAPPELRQQFQRCRELGQAIGMPVLSSPRFEADDVLATVAQYLRARGFRHTVVTGDKDLAQLIGPGDIWWDFQRERQLDARGVERHFGVRPDQIADMLALAGDKIDNIPGVPGIGQATAVRLLRRWGDLEGLYASLDRVATMQLRGARRIAELLAEHEATVRHARRLTGMLHAEPFAPEPSAYRRRDADGHALSACLDHLAAGAAQRAHWQTAFVGHTR
mgnify:CR=1 FL=1